MAYLDPKEAFEHLQKRVLEGISSNFPNGVMAGKHQSLHLDRLEVQDNLSPDDIRGQHKAKVEGDTWAVPVYAHLALKDNETGRVIDQRRIRVAEIPKTTSRYSYIVSGPTGAKEYQIDNQWQLKPGIYARRRDSGVLESQFNVTGRSRFDLTFDPASKVFRMEYGTSKSKVPLYTLMRTMGVDDHELEKAWGKEIFDANKAAVRGDAALDTFYRSTKKTPPPDKDTAAQHFYDTMVASQLRPESTALTVGKPFPHVTGEALRLATEKMLRVQAGHPEDDRDALIFKDLRATGDFAFDKLRGAAPTIKMKVARKLNTAKDVRDVIKFDMFNMPVRGVFHDNSAARVATQINPLEMVSSVLQTTVMGPGGIRSERSITDEAKFVNPSHLGFLDPINTPEGEKTGVTLRLPIGIKKVDNEARVRLYNVVSKKMELVSPGEFSQANVVLPDQVTWEGGAPKPVSGSVRMSVKGNEIRDGKFQDAHYVMPHSWQLFNMTSNLIPFLGSTSGGRASMASRQMEQAISLLHREPPLVQVGTGMGGKDTDTFERLMGGSASHAAPVNGKVVKVQRDGITIEAPDGQHHEVQLYRNYPLNDAKGVMDSTPLVHVGDVVHKGQIVADTNYSKGGTLALGTNLRVAYLPFKGYNFEDGIVISDSAAKKLSSEHLHKPSLALNDATILSKSSFRLHHTGTFKKEQYDRLGDDGVVRVGQQLHPGDPLIVAMEPYKLKDRTGLNAIRRSMSGIHSDKSVRWDSEFNGEVVGVHKSKDGVQVHVRTIEPMQVGDKMAGRYGNKGIVTMILPDREMPHTKDGKHIEVALNPSGVPGRMNVGQMLETAAGKIAQKTGKPYVVHNFAPGVDFLAKVKSDLKAHGLEDTEELIDPGTGQSLGKAMVGPQHLLKLVHQVEKKMSVRSGSSMLGSPAEHYNLNLQPASGSSTGGQSTSALGLYALLAHGAKANIREMQSYKSEGPDAQTNPAKAWPSDHNRIWAAIQTGGALPPPRSSFAFQKFTDMLRGAGVNIEKKGHQLILSPLTDDHIRALARKELPHASELLFAKPDKNGDPKPKPGGLFDEQLTGGHGGRQWTRIGLAEPVPNPVFEAPITHLTGLTKKEFASIVHGTSGVTPNGHITDAGAGVTGGAGIKLLLDRIDVRKELPKAELELRNAKSQKVDKALKRVKYLRALRDMNMTPSEAYVLHNLPVLPPVMRPVSQLPDGALKFADINQLYSDFAKINDKLKDPVLAHNLTDETKKDLRRDYYDGVKALMGVGIPYHLATHKGLLHQISGSSPKTGYFQDVLVNRRQDLTMRSTIVPEPALGLDEVGLPRAAALDLYRPFVVRKLREMGAIQNELQGPGLIAKKTPQVWLALDKVMAERPVLLKRDPALHKYSVQAFRPKAVEGNAIKIHPLVTGGFNADFDGDQQIGAVLLFVRHDALKNGLASGMSSVWRTSSWWDMRRLGEDMAARFDVIVPTLKDGALYLCDLSEVPHSLEHTTKGHIDFHAVPDGIAALAYDERTGGLVPAALAGWSFHRQRSVEIVTLASGRQILTDDDERAVYGMDDQLNFVRRRPCAAAGLFVPVARTLTLDESFRSMPLPAQRDTRLRAEVVFDTRAGRLLGTLVGDGWSSFSNGKLKGQVLLAAAEGSVAVGFIQDLSTFFSEIPAVTPHERIGGDFGEDVESRRYAVSSTAWAALVHEWIGHRAENKHLPPFWSKTPRAFRLGLLAGYFDSDGSISVSNGKSKPQWMLSASTRSIRLANEVRLLAASLGVKATITSTKTPAGKAFWTLSFSTVDFFKLQGLPVAHVEKLTLFQRFFSGPVPEEKNSYAQSDLVPLPVSMARRFRELLGTRGGASLYVVLSNAMARGYTTRHSARRLVASVGALLPHNASFNRWAGLVAQDHVHWDRVVSFEKTGVLEDGYDLTVPGYETFMSADGVVLSNTMSAFVPITREAVAEAHKMFPSNNLFSEATGKAMYQPTLESALGLYKLSLVGKDTSRKFAHPGEAIEAVRKGSLKIDDVVHVGSKRTTPGRVLLASAMPEAMEKDLLHNLDYRIDKKGLDSLLTRLAKDHAPQYGEAVNRLKDLGNGTAFGSVEVPRPTSAGHSLSFHKMDGTHVATRDEKQHVFVPVGTHSLSLDDFTPDVQARDHILGPAHKKVEALYSDPKLRQGEKDTRAVAIYNQATIDMKKAHEQKQDKDPSNLFLMYRAGVKPGWDQYKQMVLAPMIVQDSMNRDIPTPVTRSYAEGLDIGGYWTQMHGARRGSVMKVQEVSDPGYMSKLLMANMMHILVNSHDCGTSHGIALDVSEKDVHDRYLQQDFTHGKLHVPAGTLLSPDVIGKIRAAKKDAKLIVRSPLKCEDESGVCQKCIGLSANGQPFDLGTNIGVQSAQAVGERAIQLTLKAFHTGGVKEQGGSKLLNSFARFEQLMNLQKNIPDEASLAMVSGKVEKIQPTATGVDIFIGGRKHHVGRDANGLSLHQPLPGAAAVVGYTPWHVPQVGASMEAGQHLSDPNRTFMNPHHLYAATGSMEKVQNHLANEIYGLYQDEGIKRRTVETVVHAMGNLTEVVDPGDHERVLRGEYRPTTLVNKMNRELVQEGKRPIEHHPVLKGVTVLPLELHEDWMAKLQHQKLSQTIQEAAAVGAASLVHGTHPIPGLVFGSEFGLTAKDSLTPGREHLRNVPAHHY